MSTYEHHSIVIFITPDPFIDTNYKLVTLGAVIMVEEFCTLTKSLL